MANKKFTEQEMLTLRNSKYKVSNNNRDLEGEQWNLS